MTISDTALPVPPDDHFAAGPDCCVGPYRAARRIGGASSSPRIVRAWGTIGISNFRKSVNNLP